LLLHTGSTLYPDLSVLLHDGTDQLLPARPYHIGDALTIASGLASSDYNADGLNDVLISTAEGQLYVLQQDASGELLLTDQLPIAGGAAHLQAGDLNQDGLVDVVMSHLGTVDTNSSIGVSLQDATGLLPEQLTWLPLNEVYNLQDLTLGDLNQDACPDVAVADYQQGLIIYQGVGCLSGADLGIQLRQHKNRLLITGQHLSGANTTQAVISASIQTRFPVRFYADGCDLNSQANRVELICSIGQMQQGDTRRFMVWADLSQSPGGLHNVSISARIDSELSDPDPDNNTVHIRR
jgi:hypothetical protein